MKNAQVSSCVFEALLAAIFYAINMPASKVLLGTCSADDYGWTPLFGSGNRGISAFQCGPH
jgi:hypothetical protein